MAKLIRGASATLGALAIAASIWASPPVQLPGKAVGISQSSIPRYAPRPAYEALPATQALDRALEGIAASYGSKTADFVALTMEYPRP